jgi:hypothetical protein
MNRAVPVPLQVEIAVRRRANARERISVRVRNAAGDVVHAAECFRGSPHFATCVEFAQSVAMAGTLRAIAEEYRDLLRCTAESPESLEELRRIEAALRAPEPALFDDNDEERQSG